MLFCRFCLAESQTPGGETSKGENKPQPGEPEDSPATATGKGHKAQRSALSVGAEKLLVNFFVSVTGRNTTQSGES